MFLGGGDAPGGLRRAGLALQHALHGAGGPGVVAGLGGQGALFLFPFSLLYFWGGLREVRLPSHLF